MHGHVQPLVFLGSIFYLEFPQRVAHGVRKNLLACDQQYRHTSPQPFTQLLVVLNLPDQGHAGTAAFILQPEVERVISGLVEGLSAQALLGADACGQGFAETVVGHAGWDAGQDLHLLGLLEEEDGAGTPQRVVRGLDVRVAAGGSRDFAHQLSGMSALPAAGGQMTFHRNLCRLLN